MTLHGSRCFRHYRKYETRNDAKSLKEIVDNRFKLLAGGFGFSQHPGSGHINVFIHLADEFPDSHQSLMKHKSGHGGFEFANRNNRIRLESLGKKGISMRVCSRNNPLEIFMGHGGYP